VRRAARFAPALLCVLTSLASAGSVTLSNGVTGVGATSMSPDDFGSYGFLIGQQFDDEFHPAAVANPFTPTYLTGVELFITTPSNVTSSVLLSGTKFWYDFVQNPPPTPTGIDGPLTRTVPTGITAVGNTATSAFRIADTAAMGILLDVGLTQTLTSDATAVTSQFDQIYTITNNGTVTLSLVFHLAWDPDLFFNGANKSSDDQVGIGVGVCGVYAHDGDPRWSVALGNGPMSTVPMTNFYAGKEGFVPGAGPAFVPISADITDQHIWINKGMPAEWRNYVVGPGVGAVGESDPAICSEPMVCGDATLGTEYRFMIAAGATETVHIRRLRHDRHPLLHVCEVRQRRDRSRRAVRHDRHDGLQRQHVHRVRVRRRLHEHDGWRDMRVGGRRHDGVQRRAVHGPDVRRQLHESSCRRSLRRRRR
jgi:hypothetical protein